LGDVAAGAEAFGAAVLQPAAQRIVVVDPEGFTVFANPAAVSALGYEDAGELVGRPAGKTISDARHGQPDLVARTTGETVERDLDWFVRRDGSLLAVSYTCVPLDMATGRGAVLVFTDVEGQLRTENALRRHQATLAEEQASLRRVAAMAAAGAPPIDVFAALAQEVTHVTRLPMAAILRYDPDGLMTVVGESSDRPHPLAVGTRWPLDELSLSARVMATGRPLLVDFGELQGPIAEALVDLGLETSAGAPVVVNGQIWGVIGAAGGEGDPFVDRIEDRLGEFTALLATTISSSQARQDLRRLADEQAALRRVATLVAEGASPSDVFAAVAREVALVLRLPLVSMYRYEDDGTATAAGAIGDHPFQPGTNWPLDGPTLAALVRATGKPGRVEDYSQVTGVLGRRAWQAGFAAGVGAPIVVDGELWGVMAACSDHPGPLPADAERRLAQFTALVATAISNTQAREDLRRLVDEQAALRRLATLVAEGAEPQVVFDAVCRETALVLEASSANLAQFLPDGDTLTVAGWSVRGVHVRAGTRAPLEGGAVNILVRDTAAPGRVEDYADADGELAAIIRAQGIRSEVGAPVLVEGRVWGALIAATDEPEPLPGDTEQRLWSFAELIATALSNAAARTELLESRVRIVEAADEQRRRVVRDLHDGAQQRLVHAVITLQRAASRDDLPDDARPLVEQGLGHTRQAIGELRELAHGIHPEVLTHRGLEAAVKALADRAPLPVEIDIPAERYATAVESAAYFVAAEALTNVAKYAGASVARVTAARSQTLLCLVIEDDGVGGASRVADGGLAGLGDRVAALDGKLTIDSPPGRGTRIRAEIPLRVRD
jgi:PAS domain S-box-containing protein